MQATSSSKTNSIGISPGKRTFVSGRVHPFCMKISIKSITNRYYLSEYIINKHINTYYPLFSLVYHQIIFLQILNLLLLRSGNPNYIAFFYNNLLYCCATFVSKIWNLNIFEALFYLILIIFHFLFYTIFILPCIVIALFHFIELYYHFIYKNTNTIFFNAI